MRARFTPHDIAEYIAFRNVEHRIQERARKDVPPPKTDGKAPDVKNPEDRKAFGR